MRISRFFDFSRWPPPAILNLFRAYLDHPHKLLGGLYDCAKFGCDRCRIFRCHEKPHRTHRAHRTRCGHRVHHETPHRAHRTKRNTAPTPHRTARTAPVHLSECLSGISISRSTMSQVRDGGKSTRGFSLSQRTRVRFPCLVCDGVCG